VIQLIDPCLDISCSHIDIQLDLVHCIIHNDRVSSPYSFNSTADIRYWISKTQYWCKYCSIWIRDDAPVRHSQFNESKLMTSRGDNMRRVYDISGLRRGSLGICTKLGVWQRGIKSRKLRRWLGLKLYVREPVGLTTCFDLGKA
jgi:hypothetical protein